MAHTHVAGDARSSGGAGWILNRAARLNRNQGEGNDEHLLAAGQEGFR